ncbi:2,4-dienoyl-CoA reductase-like NADH-dependent reductase (Old Yellow Enzyme family) [Algoriphagus sp. 4150]|uniref:NADH:flavin oxidoreductase n=1 Tax=Algoriphagus sp. 4150 TaxID=2817756 RepID=UPI0028670A85|nr:NADH:flavin oxidoreductase [Algoriphagus sp. 4150]MDR7129526.1 2,4-dienoyl-CoA reductase-like NADH-dependent reductase (Old Yellow Enzyme family) [Algoriphagus sp. 4150]
MSTNSLFNPINLRNHQLINRFVLAPMTRRSATSEGIATSEMADYYHSFAKGGFGVIITEGTYTDDRFSQADLNQPGLVNETQVEAWATIVNRVHQFDSLIICQLMHGGALSQCREQTIAPSAVLPKGVRNTEDGGLIGPFPLPKEMSSEDFSEVLNGYVQSARLAYEAGFDGVELHAANGYLFDQFITPHTNLRTDRYGGNMYNRLRFLMEVFQGIKEVVPEEFIVGIRLSESKVNDLTYRWPGGSATAIELFDILKEINADYLHIAAEGGNWARECLYEDGLSSSGLAKKITGVPIISNGGLHDISIAEALLSNQEADLISIGRAAIANPDFPQRVAAGNSTVPFFKELIKPSLTLSHTRTVLEKFK